ncbi:MAG TPA: HEAT repeat domain-containing protein [Terriglobales bacterium]|nr:HEAT repeat domain-containing protein [Terriglobales bacterium]
MADQNISKLFSETLLGGYDDDAPWTAVHALRRIGSREVFEFAVKRCNSSDPIIRARGVDVLAQLGKTAEHPTHSFPEETYSLIAGLLERERDVRALRSEISALGHLENPLAIPLITKYRTHPSADVRFAVAFALGSFPNDPRSVGSLLSLVDDSDKDVRDWATFGIGSLGDIDSPEIREALFRRLSDTHDDVRQEAMAGLGKRGDRRVLPSLIKTLDSPPVSNCVIEAAYLMLGMDADREDWDPEDYVAALRTRFDE